jgi:hypothetical protein
LFGAEAEAQAPDDIAIITLPRQQLASLLDDAGRNEDAEHVLQHAATQDVMLVGAAQGDDVGFVLIRTMFVR